MRRFLAGSAPKERAGSLTDFERSGTCAQVAAASSGYTVLPHCARLREALAGRVVFTHIRNPAIAWQEVITQIDRGILSAGRVHCDAKATT